MCIVSATSFPSIMSLAVNVVWCHVDWKYITETKFCSLNEYIKGRSFAGIHKHRASVSTGMLCRYWIPFKRSQNVLTSTTRDLGVSALQDH